MRHGSVEKYYYEWIGINSRLDALQAAVLHVKLRHLDSWTERRQQNAEHNRQLLANSKYRSYGRPPHPYQTRHVYNQFVISADRSDASEQQKQEHQQLNRFA